MYIRIVEEGSICYANASAVMGVKHIFHPLILYSTYISSYFMPMDFDVTTLTSTFIKSGIHSLSE